MLPCKSFSSGFRFPKCFIVIWWSSLLHYLFRMIVSLVVLSSESKKSRKVWDALTFGEKNSSLVNNLFCESQKGFVAPKSRAKPPPTEQPLFYYNVPIQGHFSLLKDESGFLLLTGEMVIAPISIHTAFTETRYEARDSSPFCSCLSHRSFLPKPGSRRMERRHRGDDQIQEQFLCRFTKE